MKHYRILLFIAVGIVSTALSFSLNATPASLKTVLVTQPLDMQQSHVLCTWHQHTTRDIKNKNGTSLQITPFFKTSLKSKSATTYTIPVVEDYLLSNSSHTMPAHGLIHDPLRYAAQTLPTGTMSIRPVIRMLGCSFNLFQDFSSLREGVSGALQVPVVSISSEAQLTSSHPELTAALTTGTSSSPLSAGAAKARKTLLVGPCSGSITYNIAETPTLFCGITAGGTLVPFSKHNTSTLFAPESLIQNGNKLFCKLDAGAVYAHHEDVEIELFSQITCAYSWKRKETRLLGIKKDDGGTYYASWYRQIGSDGESGTLPAANVLSLSLTRSPLYEGCLTTFIALTHTQGYTGSFGYELYARSKEDITLGSWIENKYAVVHPSGYDPDTIFTITNTSHAIDRAISKDMLDHEAACCSGGVVGSLFVSGGWNTSLGGYPALISMGVRYEHGITSHTPSFIAGWCNIGISF